MNKEIIRRVISFVLLIIWMIVVFLFSGESGQNSGNTSRNVTIKIVNIITKYQEFSEDEKLELVEKIHPVIRKLAHYTLYTIGGVLIINYIDKLKIKKNKETIYSIIFGIVYATSDEIHQYLVPNRSMQIKDICIDTLGVITGIIIFMSIKNICSTIRREKSGNEKF